jgi:hypothetical protein
LRKQLSELERFHAERGCIFEGPRISQAHAVINRLLYVAVENISLEDMLHKFIREVTSLSWLALQSKGAIFLVDHTPGILELKAHHGHELVSGRHLRQGALRQMHLRPCAASGEIEFADHG